MYHESPADASSRVAQPRSRGGLYTKTCFCVREPRSRAQIGFPISMTVIHPVFFEFTMLFLA